MTRVESAIPGATLFRHGKVREVYEALVLGTRDYVRKNGFHDVIIGLSGGIDSSLVACIAADALGPERFREQVKIYATDVDEESLTQARQASYTAQDVRGIPEELRGRTRELLLPPKRDSPFGRRYLSLMQRHPGLVMAHSAIARLLA